MDKKNYITIHGEPKAMAKFVTKLVGVHAIFHDINSYTDENENDATKIKADVDNTDENKRELTPQEQADQLTQEVMTLLGKYPVPSMRSKRQKAKILINITSFSKKMTPKKQRQLAKIIQIILPYSRKRG